MSNKTPKVEFVITARPSWSRVKKLISEFAKIEGKSALSITLMGSAVSDKYGDIQNQMPKEIEVSSFSTFRGNESLSSIANTSIQGAQALSYKWAVRRPESVLIVADRTETLGVSLAAATMQIPLIHLQGGETSGSIDDKIRGANSKLADFHLTTNETTANNLIAIGEDKRNIAIIGCPSIDIVQEKLDNKTSIHLKSSNYGGLGAEFKTDSSYGVILFHPDTYAFHENLEWTNNLVNLVQKSQLNWFWFWPNIDFGGESISKLLRTKRELLDFTKVRFLKNIHPEDFINLCINSKILVGNSSFGIREASYIGLPVINLGHRQKGRQRSDNVLDIDIPNDITGHVEEYSLRKFQQSKIYGDGNAAKLGALALRNWQPRLKSSGE
jgi:UDP-hydrolysing UDP-N-acetyl-D-glucosamine 2-epimerase